VVSLDLRWAAEQSAVGNGQLSNRRLEATAERSVVGDGQSSDRRLVTTS